MAVLITGELDTNSRLATSSALALTTETVVTLYIFEKTGTNKKHEVTLQITPDGTNWLDHQASVIGEGFVSTIVAAAKVRACVLVDEGATSTIDFHIVAK